MAAGCIAPLRAALSNRPLVAVGLASYSIYLVHEPVIGLIENNTSWGWALAFAAALSCGFAFWFVFERPFVQTTLKRTFINYLSNYLIPPSERIAHDPERRLEGALH